MLEPVPFCAKGETPHHPSLIYVTRLSVVLVHPKRHDWAWGWFWVTLWLILHTGSLHAVIEVFIVLCEGSYPGNSGKCGLDPVWVEANPILAGARPSLFFSHRKPYRIHERLRHTTAVVPGAWADDRASCSLTRPRVQRIL